MKIITTQSPTCHRPQDPIYFMGFDKFEDIGRDCYLFMAHSYETVYLKQYEDKERVFLTFEEPNFCTDKDGPHAKLETGLGSIESYGEVFQSNPPDKILSLCPFTTEADVSGKRQHVFLPFDSDLLRPCDEKQYDVIYTGSSSNIIDISSFLNVMTKYNYIDGNYDRGNRKNFTYNDKLDFYASTKVALIHGVSSVIGNAKRFKDFPNAKNNKAFSHIDLGIVPQFKTRMIEAAFNKTIMLVYKDHWNIIESLFKPEKEFIYFSNAKEFDEKLYEIIINYDKYKYIAENAYNKAINNYTIKHFIERFLK